MEQSSLQKLTYNPSEMEKKALSLWQKEGVYKYDKNRSRQETFSIDTPPPTVSGSLHLGHMFSYSQTDVIARYQRMKGMNVFYPMGWDDNGLPTERRVQNVYGIQCSLEIPYDPAYQATKKEGKKNLKAEDISRENFIEVCNELTLEDEKVFKNLFMNLGLSVDWNLEYSTINDLSRKIAQRSFLDLFEKKLAYTQEAPIMWDLDFKTAVAQAEGEDREIAGHYYDIEFAVSSGKSENENDAKFTISTTRPELLMGCVAVVAHPDDERYKSFFGKKAKTPLFNVEVPILPALHADPEKGTGILMVCTFGDANDVDWWKQQKNLPLRQVFDAAGHIESIEFGTEKFPSLDAVKANKYMEELKGLYMKAAAKKIVEFLQAENLLKGEIRPTKRFAKFYEKGQRPLEYLSSRQWFVRLLHQKEEFLNRGKEISWLPEHMKNRFDNWVKGLSADWCIGRQRFFGVPFPVWYPIDGEGKVQYHKPIVASQEDLPLDPLNSVPVGYTESQRNEKNGFKADTDVMDTWATSSLTPQIGGRWGEEGSYFENIYPFDFRPQSHEIIRTWAFYTVAKSHFHEDKLPWRNIAISGWILDPDRKKMSKSKGNVVTPEKYLEDYGADAFRYWALRAKLGVDTAFDENQFKIGRKLCNKIFNATKFVLMQLENATSKVGYDVEKIVVGTDRLWLDELSFCIEDATKAFEKFDYSSALMRIESTFWNFCDYYIELVKVRSYQGQQEEKVSAEESLKYSLDVFNRLFAPFMPFLMEEIFHWRQEFLSETFDVPSIHLMKWPLSEEREMQDYSFDLIKEISSAIRAQKTKEQKGMKTEVSLLKLALLKNEIPSFELAREDLMSSGGVKKVELSEAKSLEERKIEVTLLG